MQRYVELSSQLFGVFILYDQPTLTKCSICFHWKRGLLKTIRCSVRGHNANVVSHVVGQAPWSPLPAVYALVLYSPLPVRCGLHQVHSNSVTHVAKVTGAPCCDEATEHCDFRLASRCSVLCSRTVGWQSKLPCRRSSRGKELQASFSQHSAENWSLQPNNLGGIEACQQPGNWLH